MGKKLPISISDLPYSRKYLEEIELFGFWIIFGENIENGTVDVSDERGDIFTGIPREKAERIIKIRNEFLDKIAEEVCL